MQYTLLALKKGFPLLINPMVDKKHTGHSVEASILLTIPEIPNLNAFCTVEYLTPVKYQLADVCYSSPVTKGDLVLICCPNSQSIVLSEDDATAFICPSNVLTLVTNISWLGFPFNPDTQLIFLRHHMAATDCSNLHPLIHLGGRCFLATSKSVLQLSTGPVTTSPLPVYHLPCNVSFVGMVTGIGTSCPDHICVSVPLSMASSLQFVPTNIKPSDF